MRTRNIGFYEDISKITSLLSSYTHLICSSNLIEQEHSNIYKHDMSRIMRKPDFCIYVKTKAQISCAVTAQLISAFVFAT